MENVRKRLAVFASGSGTTLQAIIDAIENGELNAEIVLVASNNPDAYALQRAKHALIPQYIIKEPSRIPGLDDGLDGILKLCHADLIVLAGYLKLIGPELLQNYVIINTHPSLLPKYGGKGMHGMHVHQAVVDNHEEVTGVTVHFVNEEYDRGPIIRQTTVPVYPTDTAEDVSARVQAAEKPQLVAVLKDFSEGKIPIKKS